MQLFTVSLVLVIAAIHDQCSVSASPMMEGASFVDPDHLPPADLHESEEIAKIKKIMILMKAEGENFKAKSKNNVNQFLVVAVLSFKELSENSLPANRIEVLLNKKMDDLPLYYNADNVDVHGEILALYFDRTIYNLVDQVKATPESSRSALPYVFVYSHYIPCAGMSHIQYSCAEELSNAGKVNKNRYKMVVGFTSTWKATDEKMALAYLQEGGIHMSLNMSNGQVYRHSNPISMKLYQRYMFDCLREKVNLPNEEAAFYINIVTKYCTENINRYGHMTLLGRSQMDECVCNYTRNYINEQTLQRYIPFCSSLTLKRSLRLKLGSPEGMCIARWGDSPDDLRWNELYADTNCVTPTSYSAATEKISERDFRRICTGEICLSEGKDRLHRNLHLNKKMQKIRQKIGKTKSKERHS